MHDQGLGQEAAKPCDGVRFLHVQEQEVIGRVCGEWREGRSSSIIYKDVEEKRQDDGWLVVLLRRFKGCVQS